MMRWDKVQPVSEARPILETAAEFGLAETEVWDAMAEAWDRLCAGDSDEPLELLTAALASRILEHERRR